MPKELDKKTDVSLAPEEIKQMLNHFKELLKRVKNL